jgi:hypothetical protein
MSTITFDTMQFVETLKEAGFDERQAKGLTKAIKSVASDEHLATKDEARTDLSILRADMELLKRELKADVSSAKLDMVKWMVALILGQTALLITVLPKIMGH